jgi:hypothetical protein
MNGTFGDVDNGKRYRSISIFNVDSTIDIEKKENEE